MAQIEAIPGELTQFKEALDGKVSLFRTYVSDLENKMNHLKTLSDSMEDAVSRSYTGENKGQVVQKLQKISAIYQKIIDSIDDVGDLSRIFNASETLIGDIKNLEAAKSNLETLDGEISGLQNKNPRTNTEENELSSKTSRFSISHLGYTTSIAQASSSYDTLKGMDSAFFFVTDFSSVDYSNLSPTGSSFQKFSFTASNGYKFEYYLYVPEYDTDVTGLPVHLYLHGAGESGSGVLNRSLPEMLANGYRPNGIIICPQSSKAQWKTNLDFEDALIELTNQVVAQYSADPNKVSLSGHSAGAIGGYRIIDRYPDYFSAFIPISGRANKPGDTIVDSWQNFHDVAVWAFHGQNDDQVDYQYALNAINSINQAGGNAEIYTYNTGGHTIQDLPFANTYSYQGGEPINPLDWAFQQSRV